MEHRFKSNSFACTRKLGQLFGSAVRSGATIGLKGPIGAGKTSFAQGLAKGLSVLDLSSVVSPTFSLMNIHPLAETAQPLLNFVHLDLYRIQTYEEFLEIGMVDFMGSQNVILMEWPDRFSSLDTIIDLQVEIQKKEDHLRYIELTGKHEPFFDLERFLKKVKKLE
jgi:tRNA threonylcarbamoyladenosine biosynthesis protein TsaE